MIPDRSRPPDESWTAQELRDLLKHCASYIEQKFRAGKQKQITALELDDIMTSLTLLRQREEANPSQPEPSEQNRILTAIDNAIDQCTACQIARTERGRLSEFSAELRALPSLLKRA